MSNDHQILDREQRLDVACTAYLEALESGVRPGRQDWLERYSDMADELAEFIDAHDALDAIAAPLRRVADAACLDTPVPNTTPPLGKSPADPSPLTLYPYFVGDYELLEEIGHGGMGVVYKARQLRLNRLVALKMIRSSALATPADVQRFRAEAETVALLDHPNIVPIYEVNEWHPDAIRPPVPYFSMKLIEGGSLSEHLSAFTENPRAAAHLLEQVALAVHHAHQRGVLHRDLKPGNILLSFSRERQASADADPALALRSRLNDVMPHVTDFGLAKRLTDGHVAATQTGQVVGTPSYMSPEQADGRKEAISTATDVYGLGAILYATLTGRPPHRGENMLETLEQVRTQEPLPPSKLQPKLPHDLSTICLKALAKAPERRYASAEEMADDLRRFLDGKPIQARAVSQSEKAWRWCKRNPAATGLLAAAPTFLLVLAVGSLIAFINISAKAKSEAEAKEKAETNFRYAFEAVDKSYVQVSDREELIELGLESLRRDLLRTAQQFYLRFIAERENDSELRHELAKAGLRLATIESQIGSKTEAIDLFQQTLLQYEWLARVHPTVGDYVANVASIHRELGQLYGATGKLQEAEAAFINGHDLIERLLKDHPKKREYRLIQVMTLNHWGNYCREVRRLAQAENFLCRASDMLDQLVQDYPGEPEHRQRLAVVHNDLGTVYRHTPQHERASAEFHKAQEIQEQLARDYPKDRAFRYALASTHHNLGNYWSQNGGRADLAIAAFLEASNLHRRLVREHPQIIASQRALAESLANAESLGNLGALYLRHGRQKDALDAFTEILPLFEKLVDSNPNVIKYALGLANTHVGLADLMTDRDQNTTRMERLDHAIRILENLMTRDENYPGVKTLLRNTSALRADLQMESERNEEALRDWDRAIALHAKPLPLWRILRALTVARLKRHAEAIEQVQSLGEKEIDAVALFHAARVYAVSAEVVASDAGLPLDARRLCGERYSSAAVSLLTKSCQAGYFKDADKASHLQHPDLQPLHGRDDFKKLTAAVEEGTKSGDGPAEKP